MKLIREIKSRNGTLHFRRYLLFKTRWFEVYLHRIYKADQDRHLHNHPWDFFGLILWGGYIEQTEHGLVYKRPLSWGFGKQDFFHKIKEMKATTTSLFIVWNRRDTWGYKVDNCVISHETYRAFKNNKRL